MVQTSKSRSGSDRPSSRQLVGEVTGSGPPLILLHGLSGSSRWWSRNVPAFAARFRTYTADLPGFGQNRGVHSSRLEDTADRLADWVTAEGLPRVSVAGHSLGSAVAARLAARHPDLIDRLVLVDAAIQPVGTRRLARPIEAMRTIRYGTPGIAPMLMRDLLRANPRSVVTATVDALQTGWEPHLTRIIAPTLVVWGERDAITPLAIGSDIA